MRKTFGVVMALLLLAATAPASRAANDTIKCDKRKTVAAANLFKSVMSCNHKAFADISFDLGVCRTKAYLKCFAQFEKADLIYGNACAFPGNGGNVCQETLNSANAIFSGI